MFGKELKGVWLIVIYCRQWDPPKKKSWGRTEEEEKIYRRSSESLRTSQFPLSCRNREPNRIEIWLGEK